MRKMTKKLGVAALIMGLAVAQAQGVGVALADSDTSEIYTQYYKDNYKSKKNKYPYAAKGEVDLNGDGTDEMYITYAYGVRGAYEFFYCEDEEVIRAKKFTGCNVAYFSEEEEKICVVQSGGAADTTFTTYQFNGEKFEKADCYRYKGGRKVKCYKNGKRISESKYDKAVLAMQDWEMLQ